MTLNSESIDCHSCCLRCAFSCAVFNILSVNTVINYMTYKVCRKPVTGSESGEPPAATWKRFSPMDEAIDVAGHLFSLHASLPQPGQKSLLFLSLLIQCHQS